MNELYVHYLTVSLCVSEKQMWFNWVLWLCVFRKVGMQSYLKAQMGTDPLESSLTSHDCWQDPVAEIHWGAAGQRPISGGLSTEWLTKWCWLSTAGAREGKQDGLRKIIIVNYWHLTEVRKWRQWMNKNIWVRPIKGRREVELYLEEGMLLIGVEPSEKSSKIILLQPDIVTLGNNYAYCKLY